jgi:hypothetical protein
MRENRSIERRIKNARFPVLKSLDDFQWNWPKKINRPQRSQSLGCCCNFFHDQIIMWSNIRRRDGADGHAAHRAKPADMA